MSVSTTLTTPVGVLDYMAGSHSEADWRSRRAKVARANGGKLPRFWYRTILTSNRLGKLISSWRLGSASSALA